MNIETLNNLAFEDDDKAWPVTEMCLDVAKICAVVRTIGLLMDIKQYDLLETVFASKFTSDYTSLMGGEPMQLTPEILSNQWRQMVPGIDATWHDLSHIKVSVQGNEARAVCKMEANNWVDGKHWYVAGDYHWKLVFIDGQWKANHHIFALKKEVGARKALKRAGEIATQKRY